MSRMEMAFARDWSSYLDAWENDRGRATDAADLPSRHGDDPCEDDDDDRDDGEDD